MLVAVWKSASRWLFTVIMPTLVIAYISPAQAQNGTRSFQMALWSDKSLTDATLNNGDIRSFSFSNENQPPQGPTIMVGYAPDDDLNYPGFTIDWSRVVAVLADEPYNGTPVDNDLRNPDHTFACQPPALSADMARVDAELQTRATQLKALAPKARFWVNFTDNEAEWMVKCNNAAAFNRDYIDVISADWDADGGNNNINTIKQFLSFIAANPPPSRPDQQLGLIAGVFSRPVDQLPNLQGLLDNANQTNQVHGCNLPLGNRGITGISDGCPIWIVLGWFSGQITASDGKTYVGMLEPGSESIKQTWEQELHVPLAPTLAHQHTPAQLIQPIVQLLLN